MDNFSEIEDLINKKVKTAMNSINSAKDKVKNSGANDILNSVLSGVKNGVELASKKIENAKLEEMRKREDLIDKIKKEEISLYISKKPKGRISSVILKIIGITGMIFNSLMFLFYIVGVSISKSSPIFGIIIFLIFFVINMIIILCGLSKSKRIKRFKKYVRCLDNKAYCRIDKLSESVNKDNKFVVKDLKKMMELDMFKKGHIDEEETYFILSDKVYNDYVMMQESYKKRKEEEEQKKKEQSIEKDNTEESKYDNTIKRGEEYISQIQEANNYIRDENMSLKLTKLEEILREIFKNIKENPENISYVRKTIEHYLPMTIKLVNSYIELSNQSIQGENIKNAKKEIEESIDLINKAFETLLNDLFEEVAMDISTDISALKTLFTQDGLTEEEIKR
ncbi:MAG: 5-bromo-4-chloroindolyl phosphate hydrolysis family protein [Clostridium sp.]|nr:5-bromo-4-chloroindolyl phosphate hydrolysis family protein [Clostridium sp.]